MERYDVLVLGGGYAGLMTAVRLGGRTKGLRIALVNDAPDFVERLRLHENIGDPEWQPGQRLPPLAQMSGKAGLDFIEGRATKIDRERRQVTVETLAGNPVIGYTRLVIALGSEVDRGRIPGIAEHAFVLDPAGPRAQPALKERLASLEPGSRRFVVIGGGATGIEVAAELAVVDGASVALVDSGRFATFATERVRRRLRQAVERTSIEIVEEKTVLAVEEGRVVTNDGGIAFDLCVWCGGFRGREIARECGLETDRQGRILVDPYLRALSDTAVFAAGDACLPVEWHGAPPRMSAFFAATTGAHAADVIAALTLGRKPRPFGFWTWGQAIAVGEEAIGFATLPYDRAIGPIYRGRTGFQLRRFFIWVLAKLPLLVDRYPRLPFWLGRGAYRRDAVRKYAPPREAAGHG